jgi:DNA mismatch repair protein MutS2
MFDDHALDVLEFPRVREMIARCAASAFGTEAVDEAQPSSDPDAVRRSLHLADQMAQAVRFDDPVPMGGIRDVRESLPLAARIGARLGEDALLDVCELARAMEKLHDYFLSRQDKYTGLWDIASALEPCPKLVARLDAALDPLGTVRDSASPKLGRLRRSVDGARQSLRSNLERRLAGLSDDVLADRVIAMRDGRPAIPVRAAQKNAVAGIVHDQSATGQTVYVEPMETVEDANRVRGLEIEVMREVDRILTELTDCVRDHLPKLNAALETVKLIDGLYAIGVYARDSEAVAPRIADDDTFELIDMRHPLLEARLRQDERQAVALTCKVDQDTRLVAISGPNAGGKTVALKTIGLAVAMAQTGFLIPANHLTVLPVFSELFAEIGDEQSLEQDLSTFSSRMSHLARIAVEADSGTMVLVDELGAATDPEQGEALARVLLDRWAERGSLAIVTTHLGGLKAFAHEREWACNASMEFDVESLLPTFRLIVGLPGSSYALEISRRVGLDGALIAAAEEELGSAGVHLEELISELSAKLEEVREDQVDLEKRDLELTARETDYEQRFDTVKADRKRMVREAREEAEKVLQQAGSLVERTVAELRSNKASTESIKKARSTIGNAVHRTREDMRKAAPKVVPQPDDLAIGNWVRLRTLGTKGELVSLGRRRAAVQTDQARLEVTPDDIEKLADRPPMAKRDQAARVSVSSSSDNFSPEIDVRGKVFDEAWMLVDRYLDDATMVQYKRVRIIHGKGTGALRAKFAEQFDRDDRVGAHQIGEIEEGGAGVTVVEVRC